MMNNFSSIQKTNCIISLFIFLIIWFVFFSLLSLNVFFNISDYVWSIIFVLIILIMIFLRLINKENIVSLYSLFFLTALLFLGGRFLSHFLGFDEKKLFEMDFFIYKLLSYKESSIIFYLVILGFLSMELGYYFSRIFYGVTISLDKVKNLRVRDNKIFLIFLLTVLFSFLSFMMFDAFKKVLSGGYLALFSSQIDDYTLSASSIIKTILISSTGIFLVQEDKRLRTFFLTFMGLYYLCDMILGGRGGFICYLIFLLWYLHGCGQYKANLTKILLYILVILIFLSSFIGLISLRVDYANNVSLIQQVLSLFYDQGITLMVFNESIYIDNYPLVPFFQNFITGFSFIYSTFIDSIPAHERSMSAFISYSLNPVLFQNGNGLGWSLFADAYQYGVGLPALYCLFLFLFSVFINFLQRNVEKNILIKIITISLVVAILFLPRAGLNTIFPMIPYIVFLYFFVRFFSQVLRR